MDIATGTAGSQENPAMRGVFCFAPDIGVATHIDVAMRPPRAIGASVSQPFRMNGIFLNTHHGSFTASAQDVSAMNPAPWMRADVMQSGDR